MCRWGYFDGTNTHPIPKDVAHPTNAESKAIKEWEQGDGAARYLLSERLLDITLLCLVTTQRGRGTHLRTPCSHGTGER